MKDANGREIQVGDRIRRKPGGIYPTANIIEPDYGAPVSALVSSTCVLVGKRVYLAETLEVMDS